MESVGGPLKGWRAESQPGQAASKGEARLEGASKAEGAADPGLHLPFQVPPCIKGPVIFL